MDAFPPPPLKKKATKRGLGKLLSTESSSAATAPPPVDTETNVESLDVPDPVTSIYSSHVERASIFDLKKTPAESESNSLSGDIHLPTFHQAESTEKENDHVGTSANIPSKTKGKKLVTYNK